MNKYQNENELYGQRATPEFEEAMNFLIHLITSTFGIEDCSELEQRNSVRRSSIEIRISNADDLIANGDDLN